MIKNYGFRPDIIEPEHYTLLAGQLSFQELQPDGQWDAFLPELEVQNLFFETYNCVAFATTSAIEILILRLFGNLTNNSDRALGIVSGSSKFGNTPHLVAEGLRKNGLIPEFRLPFSEVSTVEEYYLPKPLPDELVALGKSWLEEYDFGHDWIFSTSDLIKQSVEHKTKLLKAALRSSPVCISVAAWSQGPDEIYYKTHEDNHFTLCYGWNEKGWKVFDSYDNSHKIYSFESDIMFGKRFVISKKKAIGPIVAKPSFFQWLVDLIKRMLN